MTPTPRRPSQSCPALWNVLHAPDAALRLRHHVGARNLVQPPRYYLTRSKGGTCGVLHFPPPACELGSPHRRSTVVGLATAKHGKLPRSCALRIDVRQLRPMLHQTDCQSSNQAFRFAVIKCQVVVFEFCERRDPIVRQVIVTSLQVDVFVSRCHRAIGRHGQQFQRETTQVTAPKTNLLK